jgi:hypothetical protein
LISKAPLKNQASRSYMYGKDLEVEHHLAKLEGSFDAVFREITAGGKPVRQRLRATPLLHILAISADRNGRKTIKACT